MMQDIFYVVSPLVTLLAVWIAFLALLKQSRPQVLVYYRPNPGVSSIIDLVIENIGSGTARNLSFSEPIPARYYGIEGPSGKGVDVLREGVPVLAPGQQLVFDGGQFGGLRARLAGGIELQASYTYRNPLGFERKQCDLSVLTIDYLENMTTRTSGEQALVDGMKGMNNTVFAKMSGELSRLAKACETLAKATEHTGDDPKGSGHHQR